MGKLMIQKTLILLSLILSFISCNDQNKLDHLQNESVIINESLYKETNSNNYSISNATLNGDLLTIKISSSGCSADSWSAILIDANEVLESNPIQRNIKLSLENNEACLAVFESEFIFDIKILKEDFASIILNLEGWNTQINYN